ncbi:MAG: OprD family porin, partial [Desulfobacterota bacterium]|nr:OprD family porin [Thermodesulfobacteriota bacterium]
MKDRFRAASIGLAALLLWATAPAMAQEGVSQEEPTPTSVEESVSPMERSYKEKPTHPGLFPQLKEELKDEDPFFRDTKLDVNLRTYYFYRDNYPNSNPQINEAWAIGGAVSYTSGWFLNHFGVGAVYYLSEPLYAPQDTDGTQLLRPGQKSISVLGQLYARVKLVEDNYLNLYRYEYNTPYINKDDGRMVPKTFEGYTLTGASGGKDGAPGFRYGGGYITKIRERNSEDFVWMSQDAGAPVNTGVAVGGGLFSVGRFSIGAIDYYCEDTINIGYAEAKYTWPLNQKLGLLFAAQFTDQRSVGDDALKGYAFSVNQVGVKTEMSYGGAMLSLAFTTDTSGADLQNPWSSYPGYTSVQVKDFNRAKEKAFMVKAAYDSTKVGLESVTAYALFVHGWDRINPTTGRSVANENELDLDLQWRPKSGFFKNFWPRIRYGVVHQYEG